MDMGWSFYGYRIIVTLVLILSLVTTFGRTDGNEKKLGTVVYGRVTDGVTGEPLKDYWIYIEEGNDKRFVGVTDLEGEYSVQVGGAGDFSAYIINGSYWPVEKRFSLNRSEDKRVDFQMVRPEHDLFIRVHSYDERTFFEGASVTLTDMNDSSRIIVGTTGPDGWLNMTVGPGFYSVNGSWGVFTDCRGSILIENNSYRLMDLELWPPMAQIDSPNIFKRKVVDIPAKSMYVYSLGSDDMYFFHTYYQATSPVAMYGIPGYFFENFLNWTMNRSDSAEDEPWSCYDVGIGPARGGGSPMDTWMVPYRIVFVNRENVTSTVTFTIRYEYGQFYELPEGYVLFGGGSDEEEKGTNGLLIFFPILFFVILVSIVVGVVILFVQGRERSEPPKRSGPKRFGNGPVTRLRAYEREQGKVRLRRPN